MGSSSGIVLYNQAATPQAYVGSWQGGDGILMVQGDLGGGASIQLQWAPDGTTWNNFGSAVTSLGASSFKLPPGSLKVVISGGTHPAPVVTVFPNPTLLQ